MKLDQKIARRIDKLQAYVVKQENKALKVNKHNKQKGIPMDSAGQILDMITELSSLTQNI